MGLDPAEDKRFYKLTTEAFGERDFEWSGDKCTHEGWLNVGTATAKILDIGEELSVIVHFLGESMAHVNTELFPMKCTTILRKIMHAVGRYFFIRKVRSRNGKYGDFKLFRFPVGYVRRIRRVERD